MPISVRGCSPLLLRLLSEERRDDRPFVLYHGFDEEVFLQCFRQAHQDIFGMLEVVTLVEYLSYV